MISDKKHIQQLAAILLGKDITDVVISPGSRNAPLINTFANHLGFCCRNIVDERSAAYFAIGLSLAKQKPIALVCSSGTAALNYAPAIAEAFYQNIPLVVLTADRPDYWIDQAESQCIRQEGIYRNFIKKEISLPLGETEKELWYSARMINECLNTAISENQGPVHINFPLEEPLHKLIDEDLPEVKLIEKVEISPVLAESELEKLTDGMNRAKKILILAGQQNPNPGLENCLADFSRKSGAVVLSEHLSNLSDPSFCTGIDALITAIQDSSETYKPDLLITFGGQLVSKPLKQFLRKYQPNQHWHLGLSSEHFDSYQSLTKVIGIDATVFFETFADIVEKKENSWQQLWKGKETEVNHLRDEFIASTGFCDLRVFSQLLHAVPENSVLHLGNSSPVRYALICDVVENTQYFCNRGVSGIDGSLSTAVGFASESEKINTIILGDLSFFYDSNALWNKYIGKNLRIIVINNGGGNIFSMIKGPSDSPAFNEHFFASHQHKAEGLAKAFGLEYFMATNESELTQALNQFYSPAPNHTALLEIFTDAETNSKSFRELFKRVKP